MQTTLRLLTLGRPRSADDGAAVLFAKHGIADFLSCSCDAVTFTSYEDIRSLQLADETLFAVTRLGLLQFGPATIFVKMRRSTLLSCADSAPVAMLKQLIERLSGVANRKVRRCGDSAIALRRSRRCSSAPS